MSPFILGLSTLVVMSALMVVISRRPVYSILFLILCLYGIGALFLSQHSEFLAIVHLIIYAGAIMVLFLFIIMLMNLDEPEKLERSRFLKLIAICVTAGILVVIAAAALGTSETQAINGIASAKSIGYLLFTQYAAPFELSSILFLSAVVGVVLTAKSVKKDAGNE